MKRPIRYGDHDVGSVANQRSRQLRHFHLGPDADIDDQVATFDKAPRRQVGQYDRTDSAIIRECEHADAPDLFRQLVRMSVKSPPALRK